jgi:hypothetical protein
VADRGELPATIFTPVTRQKLLAMRLLRLDLRLSRTAALVGR